MKAYSMDLRQRVYGAREKESIRRTAARFEVSETFIYSLKKRYRRRGRWRLAGTVGASGAEWTRRAQGTFSRY